MSSGNGNGKLSSQLLQAQQRVADAEKELHNLDARIAQYQTKLAEAEHAVAELQSLRNDTEVDIVDERPGAVAKIRQIDADLAVGRARVSGITAKLGPLQAQRPPLATAVQQAAVALATLVDEQEFTALEEELSRARFQLGQAQEQIKVRERVVNELAERLRLVNARKRDAAWQQQRAAANADFRKLNPTPGHEVVRRGF